MFGEFQRHLFIHFRLLSFPVGYTTHDVLYRWNSGRSAVAIAEDMKLSQFDLVDCPAGNMTDSIVHNTALAGATVLNADDDMDGSNPNAKLYVCKYGEFHVGDTVRPGRMIWLSALSR